MKNVVLRGISGLVYIAVFVSGILCGPQWFFALTAVLIILGLYEFLKLSATRNHQKINILNLALTIIASLSFCSGCFTIKYEYSVVPLVLFFITFVSIFALLVWTVFNKSENQLTELSDSVLALLYVAFPLSLLNLVYESMPDNGGVILILLSLICIWINDTGAFCVGCTFGKHRLCERLSPKKSWEGFWGGLFFVVVAIVIYAIVTDKNIVVFGLYGCVISCLATVGDLFESLLKRKAGVKDSGNIIPGHGGILDRIDSFLFVSYAIILMAVYLIY